MNRIGDIGFLLGIVFIFYVFRTLDFMTLYTLVPLVNQISPVLFFDFTAFDVICFFLLIGIVGKSAQIGIHT
jgi:NADH-quinone oxidoreductase subunit L